MALLVVSCDYIDPEHIHKPYTPSGGGKTVLIKDFTGVRCTSCPGAAETLHELQHQMGEDRVFVMGVHAGFMAIPSGKFPDFRTPEGTEWYGQNSSNPLFSVDHVALTDGNTLYVDQIDKPLSDALSESQLFDIFIVNRYDAPSRQLMVESEVVASSDYNGSVYVTVCLVEDSIVGRQLTLNGIDTAYVFRNVFRGTLNGATGDVFNEGQTYVNDEYIYKYTIDLDSTYNADQCAILTYVYEKNGGKILQTAMKKIK